MIKKRMHTVFAAINLGSEKLSMQISEYKGLNRMKVIDSCQYPLRLGEETFKNKAIPISLINEICETLLIFKQLMAGDGVEEYKLQATTAVREATNQVFLLDQIYNRTGLVVEVVDLPKEIYTKYVAIRHTLQQEKITSMDGALLMMDISSGALGITLVDNNQIKYQANMHVGIIRIKESFDRNKRDSLHFNNALTEYLSSALGPVRASLGKAQARYLVLSGLETALLAKMLGQDTTGKLHHIKAVEFQKFFKQVRKLNLPQIMSIYGIPEHAAELVLPTILMYERLLDILPVEEIIITDDSFLEGMQLLQVGQDDKEQFKKWQDELRSLFAMIGQRYNYNEAHAEQVKRFALLIFDKIATDYGLGAKERLLLEGTAILHDIGKFVCLRSHSLYSYQLIMATDMLGFSERSKQIMALAAYYHANDMFDMTKPNAPMVPRADVPLVAKLAAIIRLADAMDRSYTQKIDSCKVSITGQTLLLKVQCKKNMSLENWTFGNKAEFFEEVYGLKPVLERVK